MELLVETRNFNELEMSSFQNQLELFKFKNVVTSGSNNFEINDKILVKSQHI